MKFKLVVIVGVGGVGWPLTVSLCRHIEGRIPVWIFDDDDFEGGNGHKRFPHVYDTKKKKVNYISEQIEGVWRNVPPIPHARRLTPAMTKLREDWSEVLIVDCSDMDPQTRGKLWKAFTEAGATMMRVSYDGKIANVARGLPLLSKKGQQGPGGYTETPDLAMSFAAGGWGCKYVMHALETGEIEEGKLEVPPFKILESSDAVSTASRELSDNEEVPRAHLDGGGSDSGDSGGSVGGGGVGSDPAGSGERELDEDPRRESTGAEETDTVGGARKDTRRVATAKKRGG